MKAIILAAGYATRLFPLTKDFPKPLLHVGGRPIVNHILEKIKELGINDIYVVTNSRFAKHFKAWAKTCSGKITVVDDGTTSNEDRLGAIGDIAYTIDTHTINEDVLIIGGDNLFRFSLKDAHDLFLKKKENTIVGYDVGSLQLATHYGVIEIDHDNRVLSFEEKPAAPKSTFCAICVYLYPKKTLPLLKTYLVNGNSPDAPGNFAAWLVRHHTLYAAKCKGKWYDIGNFESLKDAKEEYGEKQVNIEDLKKGIMH